MPRQDPTYQPITVHDGWFAGEDQTINWTISNAAGNAVQDLTGFSMQFKMAATKGGASVLTKTVTSASPTTGLCTMVSAAADTSGLIVGGADTVYHYTLRRIDSGQNRVMAWGPVTLQAVPT